MRNDVDTLPIPSSELPQKSTSEPLHDDPTHERYQKGENREIPMAIVEERSAGFDFFND
jgi:hypothetical protein